MSGGYFDYKNYEIAMIADGINQLILTNDSNEKNEWGDDKGHHYSEETLRRFKEAEEMLRKALVYVHRIDYLVSGDDSEESFHTRLEEDLIKNEHVKR